MLVGCGSAPALPANEPVEKAPSAPVELEVPVPGPPNAESLGLMHGTATVHVGDNAELVFEQFPRPKGAVESTDDPPVQIVGAKTDVWDKDQESFALLSLESRILVAVHTKPVATAVDVLLERYSKKFGQPNFVSRGEVEYRFWENADLGQTLMLCWTKNAADVQMMTSAVGLSSVMREFRMDPTSAATDVIRASNLLEANKAQAK